MKLHGRCSFRSRLRINESGLTHRATGRGSVSSWPRLRALAPFFRCLDFVQGRCNCFDPLVRPNKPQSIDQLFVAFLAGLLWRQLTHDCLPHAPPVPILSHPPRECKTARVNPASFRTRKQAGNCATIPSETGPIALAAQARPGPCESKRGERALCRSQYRGRGPIGPRLKLNLRGRIKSASPGSYHRS
jgi:hypothetical protein